MSNGRGSTGNVIAALASFFIPGLGQLIQGRVLAALLFFLGATCGYSLVYFVVPAFIGGLIHLWSIVNAALWRAQR